MFYFGRWGIDSQDALAKACAAGDMYTVSKALRDGAVPSPKMLESAVAQGHMDVAYILMPRLGLSVPAVHAMRKPVDCVESQDSSTESADNDIGFVYLAVNKSMPGLVKIGMTTKENVDERMKTLSNSTAAPFPFKCVYACKVRSPQEVEAKLHKMYDFCRANRKKEFFKIDWRAVKVYLQTLEEKYAP